MSDRAYLGLSMTRVQTTRYSTYEAHIFHAQIAEFIDRKLGNFPDVHGRNGSGGTRDLVDPVGVYLAPLCHPYF